MMCHYQKTGWESKMTFLSLGKGINMVSKLFGIINSIIIILLILVAASVFAADRASLGLKMKLITAL